MPLFYFDLREGKQIYIDYDGRVLIDVQAAEREAIKSAASIGEDVWPTTGEHDIMIDVFDQNRSKLFTVTAAISIDRASTASNS